jgi:UDP-N-acetylmuramoylalanine--D-glutamate ligase
MLDIRDIRIPGSHNVENYLAAICAAEPFATVSAIRDTAVKFAGVEHRIEYVRTINGARYYNDSSSSGPTRTIACLKAFPDKVILIAGGKDKALDYSILGEWLATKVKLLVLCGQTTEKIKNSLLACRNGSNAVPLVECASLEDAVRAAWENAAMHDVVVMSPASTSFDRFKNFEERGRVFKALVNALPDSTLNYPPTSRTAQ